MRTDQPMNTHTDTIGRNPFSHLLAVGIINNHKMIKIKAGKYDQFISAHQRSRTA